MVTWTVEDASGNTNTCTQTVTVQDNEFPEIVVPNDIIVNSCDNNELYKKKVFCTWCFDWNAIIDISLSSDPLIILINNSPSRYSTRATFLQLLNRLLFPYRIFLVSGL